MISVVFVLALSREEAVSITTGGILSNDLKVIPRTGRFIGKHRIADKVSEIYKENASFFVYDNLFSLSVGLSEESKSAINYAAGCLISCEQRCQCPPYTNYLLNHKEKWQEECTKMSDLDCMPEVLYFHHGLRFASQKLQKYVANKAFFDVGAYRGESIYILSKHNPSKIYSYELGRTMYNHAMSTVKRHGLEHISVLNNKGISDKPRTIRVRDSIDASLSVNSYGSQSVELVTIDDERKKYNMKVGFIKADVEGHALCVLEGARKTIEEDRPVMSISIYHSFDEFFLVREFIRQFPNYKIDFHSENDALESFCEVSLFAYPAEIEYDIFRNSPQV